MPDVKLSSKNQIVIPREARETLGLKPGTTLRVVVRGDLVILLRKPRKYANATAGIGRGLYTHDYLRDEREDWR